MHSKIIYRIASTMVVAAALFITSCSKKDNGADPAPATGGSDSSKPAVTMAPEKYTKKAIVEEFTATWCPNCPRMPILLNKLHEKFPNLIVAVFHGSDDFQIKGNVFEAIMKKMKITGYPTSMLERRLDIDWGAAEDYQEVEDSVAKAFSKTALLGFALNTSISGNTLNVTVKVGVGQTLSAPKAKVLLYVVENGLVAEQSNGYVNDPQLKDDPYFGPLTKLPETIGDYVHQHVVRKVLTDATGDEIPASFRTKGAIFSKDYTVDISKYKAANLQVVAVAFGEDQNGNELDTYNAQVVKAGESQQFD